MSSSPARTAKKAKFRPRTVATNGSNHFHLDWVVCSKPLPGATCDDLVALGRSFHREKPTVVGQERLKAHRVGNVHILPSVPETQYLYRMLWDTALDATKGPYG